MAKPEKCNTCGMSVHIHCCDSRPMKELVQLRSENAALKQDLDIIKSELKSRVYLHNTLSEWVVKVTNRELELKKEIARAVEYIERHPDNAMLVVPTLKDLLTPSEVKS